MVGEKLISSPSFLSLLPSPFKQTGRYGRKKKEEEKEGSLGIAYVNISFPCSTRLPPAKFKFSVLLPARCSFLKIEGKNEGIGASVRCFVCVGVRFVRVVVCCVFPFLFPFLRT